MQDRAPAARGSRHREKGADLEAALSRIAVGRLVRIGEQPGAVVAAPAVHELGVPGFVDLARIRRGRPVRDAAGAHERNALRHLVAGLAQRFAEGPGAVQRRQRRTLAVDVDRDDIHVIGRREEVERHHDAVVELPFFGVGHIDRLHHLPDDAL